MRFRPNNPLYVDPDSLEADQHRLRLTSLVETLRAHLCDRRRFTFRFPEKPEGGFSAKCDVCGVGWSVAETMVVNTSLDKLRQASPEEIKRRILLGTDYVSTTWEKVDLGFLEDA
jgi:hypothetical protein